MATTIFHSARTAAQKLNIPLPELILHANALNLPRTGRTFSIGESDFPKILNLESARLKNQLRSQTAQARSTQTKIVLHMQQCARLAGLIADPRISQKLVELGRVIDSEVPRSPGMNASQDQWSRFSAQAVAFARGPEFAKAQKIFSEVSEMLGK